MSNPTNRRIDTMSRVIHATPEQIYQAYMEAEALATWLPPIGMTGRVDLFEAIEGGNYQITLTYVDSTGAPGKSSDNTDVIRGRFLQLIPNQKIVASGVFEGDDPQFAGELTETWYLEAVEEGTKVTLVMENVPAGIPKDVHLDGLNSSLDNLAKYVEK